MLVLRCDGVGRRHEHGPRLRVGLERQVGLGPVHRQAAVNASGVAEGPETDGRYPCDHDRRCDEKGRHEPRRPRNEAPEHGTTCLGSVEDHLKDRETAGAPPRGEEELHRGILAGEDGDPRDPCRNEYDQAHNGVRHQNKRHKRRRVDKAGGEQHDVARQFGEDARERECASDGTDPERAQQ